MQIFYNNSGFICIGDAEKRNPWVGEEGREAEYIRGYGQYSELYESIMRLKENERTCIILYYFEEYSIREIAQCLESTESAVKKRLVRAREHLRGILKAKSA